MQTLVTLEPTKAALAAHLAARNMPVRMLSDVEVREYATHADDRIDWPVTSIVVVRGYGVAGFVDCMPNDIA
jgi:hypothetical protein